VDLSDAPDDGVSPEQVGLEPPKRKRSFTTRQAEHRAALVRQSWPDFLRDLAIRTAVIVAAVLVVLLVMWLTRG
jgi:hypothetical protein